MIAMPAFGRCQSICLAWIVDSRQRMRFPAQVRSTANGWRIDPSQRMKAIEVFEKLSDIFTGLLPGIEFRVCAARRATEELANLPSRSDATRLRALMT